jgi:mono/diheme cytochrome c family protein
MMMRGCVIAVLLGAAGCSRDPTAGAAAQARGPAGNAPATRGAQLYLQNCVPCHREDGRGVTGVYPSLAGSSVATGDPVALARWALNGVRPASLPAGRYATQMLQFGWLKDADAAALLTYVRSSFGNQAPAVDEALIGLAKTAN